MSKQLIKEAISPEIRSEILNLGLAVEEATLKLYKYVSTNNVDKVFLNNVLALKTKISEFNVKLQKETEAALSGELQNLEQNMGGGELQQPAGGGSDLGGGDAGGSFDLGGGGDENPANKEFLEAVTEPGVAKFDELNEAKNKRGIKLQENWRLELDVTKEVKVLSEAKGTIDYKKNKAYKAFVDKLNEFGKEVAERFDESEQLAYTSKVDHFKYAVKDVNQFNESINSLYDWADSKKVYIKS